MRRSQQLKTEQRQRRIARVRSRIRGSATVPRLAVFRSAKHISVQLINDDVGRTLLAASDRERQTAPADAPKGFSRKVAIAYALGQMIAKKANKKGITRFVFDRRGYRYHGRVAALARGVRDGGITM